MSLRPKRLAVVLRITVCISFLMFLPAHGRDDEKGTVGLRELIDLALQNDPGLVALRNKVPVERARKRAAVQWRDPEIRLGLSTEDNLRLEQPYTRSGSVTETTRSRGTSRTTGGLNGSSVENRGTSETRTTNYTEKIVPGATSDRIVRTETETTRTSGSESAVDGRGASSEKISGTEVTRTTTDEIRHHGRDRFAEDQTASVRVRFWIPKPWEKTAILDKAARVIDRANYEITAAERQVILEVRAQYENLLFLSRKLETSRGRIAIIEEHVKKEQELLEAGGSFTLDQLSFEEIKIPGMQLAIDAAETELKAGKRTLAARVGLADGERIRLSDNLLRSGIDLQNADLGYLTRMAFAHRGEVGLLKAEKAIAEAELDIVKTKRIPWFSFLEAGYAQDATGGDPTNDNYSVQVGVTLPLFSWLAKDERVVQAEIGAYFASLEANRKNIANEVAEAIESVQEANRYRTRTEAAVARHSQAIGERAKGLEASEDLAAKERLRYESEMERYRFQEHLLAADRLFNQSLIRLERALGADLDEVFKTEFESSGLIHEVELPNPPAPESKPVLRATPVVNSPVKKEKPTRKKIPKLRKY